MDYLVLHGRNTVVLVVSHDYTMGTDINQAVITEKLIFSLLMNWAMCHNLSDSKFGRIKQFMKRPRTHTS